VEVNTKKTKQKEILWRRSLRKLGAKTLEKHKKLPNYVLLKSQKELLVGSLFFSMLRTKDRRYN